MILHKTPSDLPHASCELPLNKGQFSMGKNSLIVSFLRKLILIYKIGIPTDGGETRLGLGGGQMFEICLRDKPPGKVESDREADGGVWVEGPKRQTVQRAVSGC